MSGLHDLRGFLALLERRGQLARIETAVDSELESTALCRHMLMQDGPALLMTRTKGSRHALLGNLFGHRSRIELAQSGRPLLRRTRHRHHDRARGRRERILARRTRQAWAAAHAGLSAPLRNRIRSWS